MTERVHALTRLGAGDYLLPSNDGQTLLRIHSYLEDGSAEDWNGRKITGTHWSYSGYRQPLDGDAASLPDDLLDPMLRETYWAEWGSGYRTRAAAIADALAERST